jgi:hypothetical protein
VLVFGWQGGEPLTAAAFVVFFSSRVARSLIKRPLAGPVRLEPAAHARRFLLATAAGWFGSGLLAAAAALMGEGQEWLYVAPFFLVMGALQVFVLRWAGTRSSREPRATLPRRLGWLAFAAAAIAVIVAGAVALRKSNDRSAPAPPSENGRRLKYELLASKNSDLRIRNLDAFTWSRVQVFIGQGGQRYACEDSRAVAPSAVLTVDLSGCLSDEGLTADMSRPITFGVRAVEGAIDSRRQ